MVHEGQGLCDDCGWKGGIVVESLNRYMVASEGIVSSLRAIAF